MEESQRGNQKLLFRERLKLVLLFAWNAGPIQRAWNSTGVWTMLAIALFLATGLSRPTFGLDIRPLRFDRSVWSESWPQSGPEWGAHFFSIFLLIVALAPASRALYLYRRAGILPMFWVFLIAAGIPIVLLYATDEASRVTSLSTSQLVGLSCTASVAQLVFARHAWHLRKLPLKAILEGVHSGFVFLGLNVAILWVLLLLGFVDDGIQLAVNSEYWAILGAAQLLAALTSGQSERRAALAQWEIHRRLASPKDVPACNADHGWLGLRKSRLPAGTCRRTASRRYHDS